jgi:hypothetical protein
VGRPRKRWRDQLHVEDQGTGNTPDPSCTWWRSDITWCHFSHFARISYLTPPEVAVLLSYYLLQCAVPVHTLMLCLFGTSPSIAVCTYITKNVMWLDWISMRLLKRHLSYLICSFVRCVLCFVSCFVYYVFSFCICVFLLDLCLAFVLLSRRVNKQALIALLWRVCILSATRQMMCVCVCVFVCMCVCVCVCVCLSLFSRRVWRWLSSPKRSPAIRGPVVVSYLHFYLIFTFLYQGSLRQIRK